MGDHYNPRNTRHGSPVDAERHVGDLGNIIADESGRASFKFADEICFSLRDYISMQEIDFKIMLPVRGFNSSARLMFRM